MVQTHSLYLKRDMVMLCLGQWININYQNTPTGTIESVFLTKVTLKLKPSKSKLKRVTSTTESIEGI